MSQVLPDDGTTRLLLAELDDHEAPGHGIADATVSKWVGVDRTLVSHWREERRAFPVWALRKILARVRPRTAVAMLRVITPRGVQVSLAPPEGGMDPKVAAPKLVSLAASLNAAVAAGSMDGVPAMLDEIEVLARAMRGGE